MHIIARKGHGRDKRKENLGAGRWITFYNFQNVMMTWFMSCYNLCSQQDGWLKMRLKIQVSIAISVYYV